MWLLSFWFPMKPTLNTGYSNKRPATRGFFACFLDFKRMDRLQDREETKSSLDFGRRAKMAMVSADLGDLGGGGIMQYICCAQFEAWYQ